MNETELKELKEEFKQTNDFEVQGELTAYCPYCDPWPNRCPHCGRPYYEPYYPRYPYYPWWSPGTITWTTF